MLFKAYMRVNAIKTATYSKQRARPPLHPENYASQLSGAKENTFFAPNRASHGGKKLRYGTAYNERAVNRAGGFTLIYHNKIFSAEKVYEPRSGIDV